MAYSLVDIAHDTWGLRDSEVALPAREVCPKLFADDRQTAPARAAGDLANTILQAFESLWGHPALHDPPLGHPEREAEELAFDRRSHRALGFVAIFTAAAAAMTRSPADRDRT